ncbi:hypothetical protein ACQPUQ_12515 [Clostridium paraputrificum]|uniref:hypothetical protein n=1 Tax=Clostridium TaxID=1485 RepID=UPI0029028D24|nr:hypothetical protein [Clostridium sp.]MDU1031642.1 hypothetical protein [Clostridium sp.]
MEARLIGKNKTRVKLSNKKEKSIIEQLKFLGAIPTKESIKFTYFEFDGDIATTARYLGFAY